MAGCAIVWLPISQAQSLGSGLGFNPYIEMPLIDIACGQIMRSNGIINIILYYTWDITVFVSPTEFEYGLEKEIDCGFTYDTREKS